MAFSTQLATLCGGTGFRGLAGGTGELGRRPWVRNAPEVEVVRGAAVVRGEAERMDGLASGAVVVRGEAACVDGLASVVRRDGTADPVGAEYEVNA